MRLSELPSDNVFFFNDDDFLRHKYLRVDTGFMDVIADVFRPLDSVIGDRKIVRVHRSFLWREAAHDSIPQYLVEGKMKDALEKYKKTADIQPITEYFFKCMKCGTKNRRSRDLKTADASICRTCRALN